jgi:hypothetical protein
VCTFRSHCPRGHLIPYTVQAQAARPSYGALAEADTEGDALDEVRAWMPLPERNWPILSSRAGLAYGLMM